MADRHLANVLHHLSRQTTADAPDRELLERFLRGRDESAFAALVGRHGGMVLGVCRRLLGHAQDAEDACQAVFLVLARKAGAIRRREALPGWLHGVACRVCRKLQSRRVRQQPQENPQAVSATDVPAEVTWREVRRVLDEELNRLPGGYRAPLVLCYLEGKTQDEAAHELGWSLGTVRGRIERGRDLLRKRLTRRGVTLSGALLGALLTQHAGSAEDAAETAALRTSLLNAIRPAGTGLVPARAVSLAEGVIRTMSLSKYVWPAAVGLTLVLLGVAAGGFLGGGSDGRSPTASSPPRLTQSVPREPQQGPNQGGKEDRSELPKPKAGEPAPARPQKKDPALEANLAWHQQVGKDEIRLSWFPDGNAKIAMICRVDLAKQTATTAREVFNWATQASRTQKLSRDQVHALHELAAALPPSQEETSLLRLVLVSVRDGDRVRTYRYNRFDLPPALARLLELAGAKK